VSADQEIASEQAYVDRVYARLAAVEARTEDQLAQVRRDRPSTPQNRSERDAFAALYEDRLARLRAVRERLCFGRLDLRDGTRHYIGRIGLADDEHNPMLIDWRSPAAEAFYRATAANPGEVVRRRHLTTRGRSVIAIEDDVLDVEALTAAERATLQGEGALLAAVTGPRTGQMRDIVATIQAEQDRIIRAEPRGVLVVQGGPGTGKTAVALHRVAYLLHTHRRRLAASGVLVVGPNNRFLRYIDQVLPALGETGVLMATPAELYPGIAAVGTEPPEVAFVKGRVEMADVVARAVAARQRVPDSPRELDVHGTRLMLAPRDVAAARAKARAGHQPHNAARLVFVRDVLDRLARRYARTAHLPPDADTRERLAAELRESPDVRREVNLAWMPLTPQRLLADLFANPAQLAAAAPQLPEADRARMHRNRGMPWTTADVPLLDEAADLLGEDEAAAARLVGRRAAESGMEADYAAQVLAAAGSAAEMISAAELADRYRAQTPWLSPVERAARDRTWSFGHVVVDEAQELSPMMWRLLMRRCPSRSMTLVGDVAQTGALGGADSWAEVLDPYVRGRWRQRELTVNYRTPRQIMAAAARMLAVAASATVVPTSVRDGDAPTGTAVPSKSAVVAVALEVVRAELQRVDEGQIAVIAPARQQAALTAAFTADIGGGPSPSQTVAAGRVDVLTVVQAKGLEFDAVVLVEPAAILAESQHGINDLYVAMTRPTQRLHILHAEPLPAGLAPKD
jgi:DNA helicase IV